MAVYGRIFWTTKCSLRHRFLALQGFVQSALIDALVARANLTPAALGILDRFLLRCVRIVLRGKATRREVVQDEGGGSYTKFTKVEQAELWRRSGMVPMRLESTLRRIKWMQSCAQHRAEHAQLLAAFYGTLPDIDGAKVVEGNLIEGANSWARQSQRDFGFKEKGGEAAEMLHEDCQGSVFERSSTMGPASQVLK